MAISSQIPATLDQGMADGSLAKLTISYKSGESATTKEIPALFNPNNITITETTQWNEKKTLIGSKKVYSTLEFEGISPATLSLELFFDTYEGDPKPSDWRQSLKGNLAGSPLALYPLAKPTDTSVTKYTEAVAKLARIDQELHRPPICTLRWGRFEFFQGVLTSVSQRFTMFRPDGTPVRATLNCTFQQYERALEAMQELDPHSADVPKMRQVRRGDTLSSIAAEAYGDPGLWRLIAKANQLVNPRALRPGQTLKIPKLKP